MKRILGLFLIVFTTGVYFGLSEVHAAKRSFGTITGAVHDNKGNPVKGALISLLRDGATTAIKQTRTDASGRFVTRVSPGKYGISAFASGFNEVIFANVEVRASQELIYRFNLEPIGSGRTLPEQRRDREDVKWKLRSAQSRRSIFQAQEDEDATLRAILGSEPPAPIEGSAQPEDSPKSNAGTQLQGVVETYFTSNAFGPSYPALNFALSASPTEKLDLIVSGQTGIGPNATERIEATTHLRAGQHHRMGVSVGALRYGSAFWTPVAENQLDRVGQFSVRAIDEWVVRDGIVIVLGLDYSRFLGAGSARSINPRFGIQFDVDARTRFHAAYAPGGDEAGVQSIAAFEDSQVVFKDGNRRPIAFVDGRAVMERSHRLEFGVERVLDNNSNLESTAFFDTTSGRGVGLLSTPLTAFSGTTGEAFINVANQQGASRGMRVVYTRRLSRVWTATAGYSFGRGQRLASGDISRPADIFVNGFFQSAAFQLGAGFRSGTNIRTVLRFSPNATVFAIDPFAGQIGVYDPSLSIQVTQDLPSFGLPVRAEAVLDARNLMDVQANTENGEVLTQLTYGRRSVRGGISLRF